MNPFSKTCAAGAAGGILFWLLQEYSGGTPFANFPIPGQMAATAFLGAGAGLVGVFILTESNLDKIKTYVFALLCGTLWHPVLTAGQNTLSGITTQQTANAVSAQTDRVTSAVKTDGSAAASQAVASASTAVVDAINTLPAATNVNQKKVITDRSDQAITALESAGTKAPDQTIDALQKVASAAVTQDEPQLATRAVTSLSKLAQTSTDATVRSRAQVALKSISVDANKKGRAGVGALAAAEASRVR